MFQNNVLKRCQATIHGLVSEGYNFVVVWTGPFCSSRGVARLKLNGGNIEISFSTKTKSNGFSSTFSSYTACRIFPLPFRGPMIRPVEFHRRVRATHVSFTREAIIPCNFSTIVGISPFVTDIQRSNINILTASAHRVRLSDINVQQSGIINMLRSSSWFDRFFGSHQSTRTFAGANEFWAA